MIKCTFENGGEASLRHAIVDNPNRPNEDRQNIAFVYYCQALEKTGQADDESTKQKWFSTDDLPPREQMAFDHIEDIEFYLKSQGRRRIED